MRQNRAWDLAERAKYPGDPAHIWGHHQENWLTVNGPHHLYLFNRVDDARQLVNFGPSVPGALLSVPFFVGIAHMGYHVFPGTFGQVIEGHSTREIDDPKTLQSAPFNPIGGGGPTDGLYRSGLIAVPPGSVEI